MLEKYVLDRRSNHNAIKQYNLSQFNYCHLYSLFPVVGSDFIFDAKEGFWLRHVFIFAKGETLH